MSNKYRRNLNLEYGEHRITNVLTKVFLIFGLKKLGKKLDEKTKNITIKIDKD